MIDEKILIEKIQDHAEKVGGNISKGAFQAGYLLAHEHIIDIIHLMQTKSKPIAPVIPPLKPVVLCKDCSFWDKFLGLKYCRKNNYPTNENDFCSYGERKD